MTTVLMTEQTQTNNQKKPEFKQFFNICLILLSLILLCSSSSYFVFVCKILTMSEKILFAKTYFHSQITPRDKLVNRFETQCEY